MSNAGGTVFLLLGPEYGAKEEFVKNVKKTLTRAGGEGPETHTFYPFETPVNTVVSLLQNGSLFSSRKLVLLHNAETIKKKDDISLLLDYCKHPSPDATFLLLSDEIRVDKKLEGAVGKSNKKIFWEMFENQKESWIVNFFKKKEMRIKPDAAQLILDLVENNTRDLQAACDRLASFLGPGETVTEADIEQFIYHSKEENIFTLFDALAERDITLSLEITEKILQSGEATPVQVLGGLSWQFRKLLTYSRFIEEHYNPEEAFAKIKIRGKRVQQTYKNGRKKYTPDKLEEIILLLSDYDASLREMRPDTHAILLSLFIYYAVKA
jgi:DNA polymerase III subunit delta